MRFGMGIILTPEEEKLLAPVVKPCYAALGLANDYFSFDVEWQEFQLGTSGKGIMTNLVWLFMQWDQVDVEEAKRRVREVTNRYEEEYRQRVDAFLAKEGKGNDKLKTYLHALGYQIPGECRVEPALSPVPPSAVRRGQRIAREGPETIQRGRE
jgi:hypothetical protein